ncbi:MAG TPA: hypothetical protein VIL86_13345 [Tepidisphaeraceae bacterium]|jgi:phage FluMu protein Com
MGKLALMALRPTKSSDDIDASMIRHLLVKGCVDAGCVVQTEVVEGGWGADVLAVKGKARIALRVELGRNSKQDMLGQQEQYEAAGMRGYWFVKKRPRSLEYTPSKHLPVFELSLTAGSQPLVRLYERDYEVSAFIASLLASRVHFCERATATARQLVRIAFLDVECWKCKQSHHIYHFPRPFASRCGIPAGWRSAMWSDDKPEFRPEVIAIVESFLASDEGRHLHVGNIKRRYSDKVKHSYLSFGCPKCDAIFGDWHLNQRILEAGYEQPAAVVEREVLLGGEESVERPHWCFPPDGVFCE